MKACFIYDANPSFQVSKLLNLYVRVVVDGKLFVDTKEIKKKKIYINSVTLPYFLRKFNVKCP